MEEKPGEGEGREREKEGVVIRQRRSSSNIATVLQFRFLPKIKIHYFLLLFTDQLIQFQVASLIDGPIF